MRTITRIGIVMLTTTVTFSNSLLAQAGTEDWLTDDKIQIRFSNGEFDDIVIGMSQKAPNLPVGSDKNKEEIFTGWRSKASGFRIKPGDFITVDTLVEPIYRPKKDVAQEDPVADYKDNTEVTDAKGGNKRTKQEQESYLKEQESVVDTLDMSLFENIEEDTETTSTGKTTTGAGDRTTSDDGESQDEHTGSNYLDADEADKDNSENNNDNPELDTEEEETSNREDNESKNTDKKANWKAEEKQRNLDSNHKAEVKQGSNSNSLYLKLDDAGEVVNSTDSDPMSNAHTNGTIIVPDILTGIFQGDSLWLSFKNLDDNSTQTPLKEGEETTILNIHKVKYVSNSVVTYKNTETKETKKYNILAKETGEKYLVLDKLDAAKNNSMQIITIAGIALVIFLLLSIIIFGLMKKIKK